MSNGVLRRDIVTFSVRLGDPPLLIAPGHERCQPLKLQESAGWTFEGE
jgi:hypothetical protein